MKKLITKILIGTLLTSSVVSAETMSHWANIRDPAGNIIGVASEGDSVVIYGEDENDPSRTLIYDSTLGIEGSVSTIYIYGGDEYYIYNPTEYIYPATTEKEDGCTEDLKYIYGSSNTANADNKDWLDLNTNHPDLANIWLSIDTSNHVIYVYAYDMLLFSQSY